MVHKAGNQTIEVALPGTVVCQHDFVFILNHHCGHRRRIVVVYETTRYRTLKAIDSCLDQVAEHIGQNLNFFISLYSQIHPRNQNWGALNPNCIRSKRTCQM